MVKVVLVAEKRYCSSKQTGRQGVFGAGSKRSADGMQVVK